MHGRAHHFQRQRGATAAARARPAPWPAEYLAEDYAIADIPCWPWVRAAQVIGLTPDDLPHAARWFEAVGARRAVISGTGIGNRALLAQGPVPLTPEQWSNRFGENMLAAAGKAMTTAA